MSVLWHFYSNATSREQSRQVNGDVWSSKHIGDRYAIKKFYHFPGLSVLLPAIVVLTIIVTAIKFPPYSTTRSKRGNRNSVVHMSNTDQSIDSQQRLASATAILRFFYSSKKPGKRTYQASPRLDDLILFQSLWLLHLMGLLPHSPQPESLEQQRILELIRTYLSLLKTIPKRKLYLSFYLALNQLQLQQFHI